MGYPQSPVGQNLEEKSQVISVGPMAAKEHEQEELLDQSQVMHCQAK